MAKRTLDEAETELAAALAAIESNKAESEALKAELEALKNQNGELQVKLRASEKHLLSDEEQKSLQDKINAGLPKATAIECILRDRTLREQAAEEEAAKNKAKAS